MSFHRADDLSVCLVLRSVVGLMFVVFNALIGDGRIGSLTTDLRARVEASVGQYLLQISSVAPGARPSPGPQGRCGGSGYQIFWPCLLLSRVFLILFLIFWFPLLPSLALAWCPLQGVEVLSETGWRGSFFF